MRFSHNQYFDWLSCHKEWCSDESMSSSAYAPTKQLIHSSKQPCYETQQRHKNNIRNNKEERTWSSEHHHCNCTMVMSAEERRMADLDSREISICILGDSEEKTKVEEDRERPCMGHIEDECEEQIPNNHHVWRNRSHQKTSGSVLTVPTHLFNSSCGRKSSKGS